MSRLLGESGLPSGPPLDPERPELRIDEAMLRRIEARTNEYLAQLQPQIDALRASRRITAADLAITEVRE